MIPAQLSKAPPARRSGAVFPQHLRKNRPRSAQAPRNTGGRRSRNAATPSAKSAEANSATCRSASAASAASPASGGPSADLIAASASGGAAASCRASASAASSAAPGPVVASISPMASASAASTCAVIMRKFLALAGPSRAGSDANMPMSPASPTPANAAPNRAPAAATTRSQASASDRPAPNAGPSTAASTGLLPAQSSRMTPLGQVGVGAGLVLGHRAHGGDVPSRAEGPARPGQHDHPYAVVAHGRLDGLGQPHPQRDVDGVAALRPVQRDHPDRPLVPDEHDGPGPVIGRLGGHRPLNFGGRRSITAARPSRASAVPDSSETVRASSGSRSWTPAPTPPHTSRLVAASASGALAASSAASSPTRAASRLSGTTSVTTPRSQACAAVSVGLVSRICMP